MVAEIENPSIESLRERLASEQDIVLAIAFGSVTGSDMKQESDVDLAVLTDGPLDVERRRQLIRLVAETSGRAVDLVDLRAAGAIVLRSILREGVKLVCRDRRAYEQLISRLLVDTEDFLPYRERLLKERRSAWIR